MVGESSEQWVRESLYYYFFDVLIEACMAWKGKGKGLHSNIGRQRMGFFFFFITTTQEAKGRGDLHNHYILQNSPSAPVFQPLLGIVVVATVQLFDRTGRDHHTMLALSPRINLEISLVLGTLINAVCPLESACCARGDVATRVL